MNLLSTVAVIAVALVLAAAVLYWSLRRRAAFRSALEQRGWHLSRHGDATTVAPVAGDWTVTMSRSYAAQMSPPSTRIVTTVWTASTPAAPGAALIAGPAPPPQLRALAAELVGSSTPAMANWLGIDRLSGGLPLHAVPSADQRLLVFATRGYSPPGRLTDVADAISAWCEDHPSEREQPVVSINDAGVRVRVRTDLLRSVDALEAFVDLGIRCRAALGRSPT